MFVFVVLIGCTNGNRASNTSATPAPTQILITASPSPVPTEAPPTATPIEATPSSIPIEAAPSPIPIEVTPSPIPIEAIPSITPIDTVVCGKDVALTIVGTSPLGQRFQDGDTLSLTLDYRAQGCKVADVLFYGYHSTGSDWYEYWCVSPGRFAGLATCANGRISSTVFDPGLSQRPLTGTAGTLTVSTRGGAPHPTALNSEPSLGGFTLCSVTVVLDDGIDEGHGADYRQTLAKSGSC
jgi:hypothetical protein